MKLHEIRGVVLGCFQFNNFSVPSIRIIQQIKIEMDVKANCKICHMYVAYKWMQSMNIRVVTKLIF